MSISEHLIHADTQWITIEDHPELLAIEVDHWLNHRAMLEADLVAGEENPEIAHNGIDFANVMIEKLIHQGKRIARAQMQHPRELIALEDVRSRMEAAKRLDTFEVLDRVTGTWSRLGPRDEHWMCCPLPGHDEDTPSFHMNEDGRWYCFGCQRGGGDKVSFAAAYLGKSQMSGLVLLEELFGL